MCPSTPGLPRSWHAPTLKPPLQHDTNEHSEDEAEPHKKGIGLASLYMPAAASANEDDPVYSKRRPIECPWPSTIGTDGQVKPLQYMNNGWPLHFANPDRPRAPINPKDVERVCEFINLNCGLMITKPRVSGAAVIQANIGFGKGGGNVQFYTTRLGRTNGNCRINIGTQAGLVPVRAALLKSAWFHDALEGQGSPFGHKVEAVFHPEGHRYLLPPLSPDTSAKDLSRVIKCIAENLGKAGQAAMKQYLVDCKLSENAVALEVLEKAFVGAKAEMMPARGKKRKD